MHKFLFISDFVDIQDIVVRHYSIDKGHYLAKALAHQGCKVSYMTMTQNYRDGDMEYVSVDRLVSGFVSYFHFIVIVREPIIPAIMDKIPAIRLLLNTPRSVRVWPKIVIKSDSPMWFTRGPFRTALNRYYSIRDEIKWLEETVDKLCVQNQKYLEQAVEYISRDQIVITTMAVPNKITSYTSLLNPYDPNKSYCKTDSDIIMEGDAMIPQYYIDHPDQIHRFRSNKVVLIFTGRVKVDNGKIFYNMSNIMKLLGDRYELHLFLGSFRLPLGEDASSLSTSVTAADWTKALAEERSEYKECSGKDRNNLDELRKGIFGENSNVLIHYPYNHDDRYRYLYYADLGIDFSKVRGTDDSDMAEHAKILEYCECGLPVVCEEKTPNSYLIKAGKNGIILPYMSSDKAYVEAIKQIVDMDIDRKTCQEITVKNENWDVRAKDFYQQLTR